MNTKAARVPDLPVAHPLLGSSRSRTRDDSAAVWATCSAFTTHQWLRPIMLEGLKLVSIRLIPRPSTHHYREARLTRPAPPRAAAGHHVAAVHVAVRLSELSLGAGCSSCRVRRVTVPTIRS